MVFVSVCTPTFNRRPFIPTMLENFRRQDYPHEKMQWVILDDGTDPVGDLITAANIPQITYVRLDKKVPLGEKRNLMHKNATGDVIVYMDDDDYYPPDRVSHAVSMLQANPWAVCAGSSVLHIYFKHLDKIMEFGPYGQYHATAGTFAFWRERMLKDAAYNSSAAFGEEREFLKNYTVPMVQLDPKKVILVFSHSHNTFDKRTLLKNPERTVVKPTAYTVEGDFKVPAAMAHFYTHDMHLALAAYGPGIPTPPHTPFRIKVKDRILTDGEIVTFMNQQQQLIDLLKKRLKDSENEKK
jgi:glycosyltransferase involved in cell wall biosynthesis